MKLDTIVLAFWYKYLEIYALHPNLTRKPIMYGDYSLSFSCGHCRMVVIFTYCDELQFPDIQILIEILSMYSHPLPSRHKETQPDDGSTAAVGQRGWTRNGPGRHSYRRACRGHGRTGLHLLLSSS